MPYEWNQTRNDALPVNDNTTKPGFTNNQGLHSLQGVHTSSLAAGQINGIEGARLQPESYYSSQFLERKRLKGEDLLFANYAESRSIPVGNTQITLKKYKPLRAHIVPLVEGRKPSPDYANGTAIVAKTRAYGRFMEFTDQFAIKVADPVMEEYTNELGDVAAETVDLLAQAALIAEAQVFFPSAAGVTSKLALVDAATAQGADINKFTPKLADLRLISLYMKAAKVATIGGKYLVLASPAVMYDLQTELFEMDSQAFGTQSAYAGNTLPDIFDLTFKTAMSARVETAFGTLAISPAVTPKAQVHHTIVLGAKAYSRIEIAGNGGTQFFTKELGSAGTLDPLNQRQTMGWKINALGFKVTDPDAVIDYMTIPTQSEVTVGGFDYASGNDLSKYGVTPEMALALESEEKRLGTKISDNLGSATTPTSVTFVNGHVNGVDDVLADQFEGIDRLDGLVADNAEGKTAAKDHSAIKLAGRKASVIETK